MLLGPGGQSDYMGLHRNQPVFVQNFPVIVKLPSINPGGEKRAVILLCWLLSPHSAEDVNTRDTSPASPPIQSA